MGDECIACDFVVQPVRAAAVEAHGARGPALQAAMSSTGAIPRETRSRPSPPSRRAAFG